MKFGLSQSDINYIRSILIQFNEIEEVVIFGSRAMGNFKPQSDIDICLKGANISLETLSKIKALLESVGPMPYLVDIISYKDLNSEELKNHIDNYGIKLEL